jgi:hypothetical protein
VYGNAGNANSYVGGQTFVTVITGASATSTVGTTYATGSTTNNATFSGFAPSSGRPGSWLWMTAGDSTTNTPAEGTDLTVTNDLSFSSGVVTGYKPFPRSGSANTLTANVDAFGAGAMEWMVVAFEIRSDLPVLSYVAGIGGAQAYEPPKTITIANVAVDDLYVIVGWGADYVGDQNTFFYGNPTLDTAWGTVTPLTLQAGSGYNTNVPMIDAWYVRATSAGTNKTITWSWYSNGTYGAGYWFSVIKVVGNYDTASPIGAKYSFGNNTTNNLTTTGLTTTRNGSVLLTLAATGTSISGTTTSTDLEINAAANTAQVGELAIGWKPALSSGTYTANLDAAGTNAAGWAYALLEVRMPSSGPASQTVSPSGIASTVAFGTAKINLNLATTGIASTVALGTPRVTQVTRPAGIASTTTLGAPTIQAAFAAQTLSPSSIASTTTLGTAKVNLSLSVVGFRAIRNLLTANQASVETSVSPWLTGPSTTVARVASSFGDGSYSLEFTRASAPPTDAYAMTSPRVAVTPGETYTASALISGDATNGQMGLYFYNSVPAIISSSLSSIVPAGATERRTITMVAPAGAVSAGLLVRNTVVGSARFDNMGIWAGPVGDWAMPTPEVGSPTAYVSQSVAPYGIATSATVGSVAITSVVTLSVLGINSTSLYGSPKINIGVQPYSVPNTTAFGNLTALVPQSLSVTGFFVNPSLGEPLVKDLSITREMIVQRRITEVYIQTKPVSIILTPRVRTKTVSGGQEWVEQADRVAQIMRIIEPGDSGAREPLRTSDGIERSLDYILLGRYNAEIGLYDRFTYEDDECEVVSLMHNNGYEIRAYIVRRGPLP